MRPLAVVLGLSFALFSGFSLEAAPKDAEAKRNISQSMDQFADDKDADKAQSQLMVTIGSCASDCEPRVVALAWMYMGLVSGSSNDFDAAREAFTVALGFDPTLTLDARFSSPTTQALFDGIKAKSAAPPPAAPAPDKFVAGSQLSCTPLIREVQSLRPVPLSCSTKMSNVGTVVVNYRQYGAENWTRAELKQVDGRWEGEIACTDLPRPGVWGMYFEARDKRGELLDAVGNVERPVVFKVVAESSEPAPSLPGKPAPDRCNPSSYCPEDMVGTPACDAFMSGGNAPVKPPTCSKDNACEWGMECRGDVCELAGLCSKNSDCDRGSLCTDGRCALDRTKPVLPPDESGYRDWLGIHFAADFTSLSAASDVCTEASGYTCFADGEQYRGVPNEGNAGDVAGGFHSSTLRVLLSYERFITNEISLGGRFGFAFAGAPDGFFPLHFEARGTYYFGDVPNGRDLFVPYVALGVGAAEVDSKASVSMVDCDPGEQQQLCENAPLTTGLVDPDDGIASVRTLDAYKSLGNAFVLLSPGVRVSLGDNLAAVGNLGLLLMTEKEASSGVFLSLQPTVGATLGF